MVICLNLFFKLDVKRIGLNLIVYVIEYLSMVIEA